MDQALPTKVLIVSDDARVREPATEVLLRGGFVVDEAADCHSALGSASAHRPPDIVLVDGTGRLPAGDLSHLLDELGRRFSAKTVLLASFRTPGALREHPSVVYVIDAPTRVHDLVSLADWIGEEDPRQRPSLVLSPLHRVASRAPAHRHAS